VGSVSQSLTNSSIFSVEQEPSLAMMVRISASLDAPSPVRLNRFRPRVVVILKLFLPFLHTIFIINNLRLIGMLKNFKSIKLRNPSGVLTSVNKSCQVTLE
jgi:hypothetical protein